MSGFTFVAATAIGIGVAGWSPARALWTPPDQPAAVPVSRLAETYGGHKAVTTPSRDALMGFSFPVEIAEVAVGGGQPVKAGDLLVRARDEDFVAAVALARLSAETDLEIHRAQAALELAEIEHRNAKESHEKGGLGQSELDRAANARTMRTIELDLARFQKEQQRLQLLQRESQLSRYRLVAPFDGQVDVVLRQTGQAVKDSEPVIRIVQTDPLWIDVHTPTEQTILLKLKPQDPAWMLMDVPGTPRLHLGRVIELAAVADSAGNTRRVRVELLNPEGWPAGLHAWARFTEPSRDWVERTGARLADATPGAAR